VSGESGMSRKQGGTKDPDLQRGSKK
jgi:hypothetical protein